MSEPKPPSLPARIGNPEFRLVYWHGKALFLAPTEDLASEIVRALNHESGMWTGPVRVSIELDTLHAAKAKLDEVESALSLLGLMAGGKAAERFEAMAKQINEAAALLPCHP